ncbi:3-dehydroquinate synthase [Ktedonosporobacter rubrisoli]|uniref:3-dehydroquinate synthase n=1 Tax=Ktedonosporobacter rubrisoli TaxID=2509675 RepID=A0A4V0YZ79_KTERU|nr:3-dehydroquinate synthase [Ktedonosporobacter rubrisoli]QBD78781.1 3-dehydroquinate synthase [Ktedonosporobacter rubrisoli]
MQPLCQTVQVNYRYAVHFTSHLFACENALLREVIGAGEEHAPQKILCVIDAGVCRHHPALSEAVEAYCLASCQTLQLVCPPLQVPGGEGAKNDFANVALIQEAIHRYGICRHSYVLAIGGGAVLDMVGYAAATAHRGVRLIRVPTTVLAQNDAGVGVKNSINAFGKKNFIGTFAPPVAVFNDEHFLTTLSQRDWCSGVAEAVKVALLKDERFFAYIEEQARRLVERDMQSMRWTIYRCAQLHLEHIANGGDPFETGSSRPLDFGHWAAHKLEQLSSHSLRHGEAVAIGIALDTTYAYLIGLLPEQDWLRILRVLSLLDLAIYTPELDQSLHDCQNSRCILAGLDEFREHLGGQLTLPLLERIGRSTEVGALDRNVLGQSIALLRKRQLFR